MNTHYFPPINILSEPPPTPSRPGGFCGKVRAMAGPAFQVGATLPCGSSDHRATTGRDRLVATFAEV